MNLLKKSKRLKNIVKKGELMRGKKLLAVLAVSAVMFA